MAVKERAQQFERLLKGCVLWPSGELETMARGVIEQALLAERRLAMEEAAKMVEDSSCKDHGADCMSPARKKRNEIAAKLRAAAEKEVAK